MVFKKGEDNKVVEKKEVMTDKVEEGFEIIKWAKARFNYLEMRDQPGSVWKCSPQGMREDFVDGEVYDRPLAFFEIMNKECREVKRKLVKQNSSDVGQYIKTNQYTARIRFDILETYDKKQRVKPKK